MHVDVSMYVQDKNKRPPSKMKNKDIVYNF